MVSIQLVSPASGEVPANSGSQCHNSCFHSISFPSEWGVSVAGVANAMPVSIQLVSPASGEGKNELPLIIAHNVFPFN